jgi:uncharacterized protein (TIGR02266 family)
VSDAVTTARSARESLARGLAALQSDPNVPPQLLELAAPIAQAMGALHQIERSQGAQLASQADVALSNVRSALGSLQAQPPTHPAIMSAMEAVASSLSFVHMLSKMAEERAAPPAQQPAFPAAAYAQTAIAPPQVYAPAPQPAPPAPPPARAQAPSLPQQPARSPFTAGGPGGGAVVTADLGAHSPTNFYKGLAGNDIIDHGGLFVQTYKIPKIGTPVRLKVSLPGGYEFEANAIVRWCREQSDAGNDAPPGFGAQFTDITPEARQLVYRYVRNREPLFHDDL